MAYQKEKQSAKLDALVEQLKELNKAIETDATLGKGFCIGHSYLCGLPDEKLVETLSSIVTYDILPQLQEYWFDNAETYRTWRDKLSEVVK